MRKIIFPLIFLILAGILAACTGSGPVRGVPTSGPPEAMPAVLQGKVSIGPLSPVEPAPGKAPATLPAELFTSRSMDIFQPDGKTLVKNISFNPDGTYKVELPPGTYVIDLKKSGLDQAEGLPKTITLNPGETQTLDITIDTGIR